MSSASCDACPPKISSTQGSPPLDTSRDQQEGDLDPQGLHINILKFIALIINTYMAIRLTSTRTTPSGVWIIHTFTDSISALSWVHYAART